MKHIRLLLALICAIPMLTGCASRELADGGPYDGDKILYTADKAITEIKGPPGEPGALDDFVTWEYTHRATLAKYPEITEFADKIRANARNWVETAIAARESYAAFPTEGNRLNLENAVTVLRTALSEIAKYQTQPEQAQ